MDELSVIETLRKGSYEASLVVTYNASLPFYENILLPALRSRGCRRNLVLMDRRQCAVSWGSASLRPRAAGVTYSLVPVSMPGAFHPKILLLKGAEKSLLWVGSHNLTLSGFGINREITNLVEGPFFADQGMEDLFSLIRGWVSRSDVHRDVLQEIEGFFPSLKDGVSGSDWRLAFQGDGHVLWEEMLARLPSAPSRILVLGAFFDLELAFLRQCKKEWPDAHVRVLVDPETVSMPTPSGDLDVEWVNLHGILDGEDRKRLHAKFVLFETEQDAFLWSGSANPSAPAWLRHSRGNAECMLVRHQENASELLTGLGLKDAWKVKPLDPRTLEGSSKVLVPAEDAPSPERLMLGKVHAASRTIEVPGLVLSDWDDLEFRDLDDKALGRHDPVHGGDRIPVPQELRVEEIRSLWLGTKDSSLRVMLHHPDRIKRQNLTPDQLRIEAILDDLGGSGDAAELMAALDKILVPGSIPSGIAPPAGTPRTSETPGGEEPNIPETLEVEPQRTDRRRKDASEDDLCLLLEVLGQRITSSGAVAREEVMYVPSEEERIDQEFDSLQEEADANFDRDEAIAKKVRGRFRRIVKRLASGLAQAKSHPEDALPWGRQVAVALLVARELLRAENLPRWKAKDLELIEIEAAKDILEMCAVVVTYWPRIEESFPAVCLWLAWVCELDWDTDFSKADEDSSAIWERAILALLFSPDLRDEDWNRFQGMVTRQFEDALEWALRHQNVAWSIQTSPASAKPKSSFTPGELVYAPGIPKTVCVVERMNGQNIQLLDLIHPPASTKMKSGKRIVVPRFVQPLEIP